MDVEATQVAYPEPIAPNSIEARRQMTIAGIRKMADVLETNPELDMPYQFRSLNISVYNLETVQRWVKALPGKKDKNFDEGNFSVTSDLGLGGYEVPVTSYFIAKGNPDDPREDLDTGPLWGPIPPTQEQIANRQPITGEQSNVLDDQGIRYEYGTIGYEIQPYFRARVSANREVVCEKVVVGKKYETVTKYTGSSYETLEEVDVVEWNCNPILGAPDTETE